MRDFAKKIILKCLLWEAKLVIRKYKPKIIAITGSVGKTSTKDAIYAVVSMGAHVRKSEKSFNSEIGLPLTVLGAPNAWGNPFKWMQNLIDGLFLIVFRSSYPEWLVLEAGADRPGDIQSLSSWLPVDIAVITRLPDVPVHVEFFDSPEAVAEEKASLIKALKPGGTLILYADDPRTKSLAERAKDHNVIFYGMSTDAYVHAEHMLPIIDGEGWPEGMSAQIFVGEATAPIEIKGTIGSHALLSVMGGVAVGSVFKKTVDEMVGTLKTYDPPPGRMRILHGVKETLVIDDTYNSSPAAVVAALEALAFVGPHFAKAKHRRGRRIAVLGDMLELGRHSVEEHRKLGVHTAKCATLLLTVGFRARDIAEAALDAGMKDGAILQYEDSEKAGDELEALIKPGDTILVKGSQGVRMEKIVEMLMASPERASELLARQDEEWKKR
jgi:UDP-N-acetylmuramoyl-tripeptide--D-alanyl-D-alanine ligase